MGTRSRIGKVQADGAVRSIYCHFDGYLDGVGETLARAYQDETKIDTLLSLGDLSGMEDELGEKHDWDDHPEGVCNFYGRDRGEKNTEAITTSNEAEFWANRRYSGAEFLYLRKDGAWWVQQSYPESSTPVLLSEALTIEESDVE